MPAASVSQNSTRRVVRKVLARSMPDCRQAGARVVILGSNRRWAPRTPYLVPRTLLGLHTGLRTQRLRRRRRRRAGQVLDHFLPAKRNPRFKELPLPELDLLNRDLGAPLH